MERNEAFNIEDLMGVAAAVLKAGAAVYVGGEAAEAMADCCVIL
jgi:hypothetical protein